jgi:hypothetical protein
VWGESMKSKLKTVKNTILFTMFSTIAVNSTASISQADQIDDIITLKTTEFVSTQEQLYEDFVNFAFQRFCSEQHAQALEKMKKLSPSNPMKAYIFHLNARKPHLMRTIKQCTHVDFVLSLCDQFQLNVPEFFFKETLPLAEMILRDPLREEGLETLILEADKIIQDDIKKEYTPQKLLPRLLTVATAFGSPVY